jgi:hypothetical protein
MMMYISVFPVVITMRNSNAYEERSLEIYSEDIHKKHEIEMQTPEWFTSVNPTRMYFIRGQVQRQLGHDICDIATILIL